MQTTSHFTTMIKDQLITRRTLAGDLPTTDYSEESVALVADSLAKSTKDPNILELMDSNDTFKHLSQHDWLKDWHCTEGSVIDYWNDSIEYMYQIYGIMYSITTGRQPYLLYEDGKFRLIEGEFDTGSCTTIEEAKNKWNSIMLPLYSQKFTSGDQGFPTLCSRCHTVYKESKLGSPEYFNVFGEIAGRPVSREHCQTVDDAIFSWNVLATLYTVAP